MDNHHLTLNDIFNLPSFDQITPQQSASPSVLHGSSSLQNSTHHSVSPLLEDPADETLDGPQSNKRRRLATTCEHCKKRKIRCTYMQNNPTCDSCVELKLECLPIVETRKRKQGNYLGKLEAKLEEMEQTLSVNQPKTATSVVKPSTAHWSSLNVDELLASLGISSEKEKEVTMERFPGGLPPPEVIKQLVNGYFAYRARKHLPILHPQTFMQRLAQGRVPRPLLFALLAVACKDSGMFEEEDMAQDFAKNARKEMEYLRPSLDMVQTLLMLIMYSLIMGNIRQAYMDTGIAVRMAMGTGLNRLDEMDASTELQSTQQWIELETKRRVWWSCFLADRFSASATGLPLCIDDRDCQLRLPGDDDAWINGTLPTYQAPMFDLDDFEGFSTMDSITHPSLIQQITSPFPTWSKDVPESTFSCLVRLTALSGRIVRYVNRPKTRHHKSPATPGSEFSLLDAALIAWKDTVPKSLYTVFRSVFQPRIELLEDAMDTVAVEPANTSEAILLHVMYQLAVIILHKSNLPSDDSPPRTAFALRSFHRVMEAADDVVNSLFNANESMEKAHPFLSFCLFTASCVHLALLYGQETTEEQRQTASLLVIKGREMLIRAAHAHKLGQFYLEQWEELVEKKGNEAESRQGNTSTLLSSLLGSNSHTATSPSANSVGNYANDLVNFTPDIFHNNDWSMFPPPTIEQQGHHASPPLTTQYTTTLLNANHGVPNTGIFSSPSRSTHTAPPPSTADQDLLNSLLATDPTLFDNLFAPTVSPQPPQEMNGDMYMNHLMNMNQLFDPTAMNMSQNELLMSLLGTQQKEPTPELSLEALMLLSSQGLFGNPKQN